VPPELDNAQLSAVATALADLTERVSGMADRYQGSPREDIAASLYDVERHLQAANRRVEQLIVSVERG
jgi:Mg2+ and Co2+ transporter CorA